jgi:hypothetical protein
MLMFWLGYAYGTTHKTSAITATVATNDYFIYSRMSVFWFSLLYVTVQQNSAITVTEATQYIKKGAAVF